MKITNIRINKVEGDTELLESEHMPLILAIAQKTLEPVIRKALNEAA